MLGLHQILIENFYGIQAFFLINLAKFLSVIPAAFLSGNLKKSEFLPETRRNDEEGDVF